MCGICGFSGKGSITDLQQMSELLIHRGPDDSGLWQDSSQGLYLGHRRLSIIDLAGGKQPMWTADDKLGIVFNGEIYNFRELRAELENKGHHFQTDHSDTEVLLYGYREWGENLPQKLNGMWALVIYDRQKHQLFASRDRFGKKPFFYTFQNNTFVFASELSALRKHSIVRAEISKRSLKKYFAYGYIPAPATLYENIYKLPGGHNLKYDLQTKNITVVKYWDYILEPFQEIPKHPEAEWGEELRRLLRLAVKRRLVSDVPLGVFLSGGIDSSAITAFASEVIPAGKLKTFSIGFEETSFDESNYAWQVAELFKVERHLQMFSLDKARELLPQIIDRLDEPMGDSSLLPTYLLCKYTRQNVTVALSGDGGDELFAGYDPFLALNLANTYSKLVPKPLHQAISLVISKLPVSHRNISLDFKLKRTLRGLSYDQKLWSTIWMGPLAPLELTELFNEPTDLEDVYSEAIQYWQDCPQENLVDKTLQFYTKLYLQDDILVKADRASMLNSLEVRAPFLDIDLVDFVRKIPHNFKYRNGCTKYLLKKALEPILPKEILYRQKKGFGVPIGSWFQQKKLDITVAPKLKLFDQTFVKKYFSEHQNNRADHRLFLWNYWLLSRMSL